MGRRERIAEHIAIGYLTTDTVLETDGQYCIEPESGAELHLDAELCVELGHDVDEHADAAAVRAAIAHCWPALEIVDLAPRAGEPDSIVIEDVFHRAVAFGTTPVPLVSEQQVITFVNGRWRDRAPWPVDVPDRIVGAARMLAGLDERLRAGDRIITGSITQVPIAVRDVVRVQFGCQASLAVHVIAEAGSGRSSPPQPRECADRDRPDETHRSNPRSPTRGPGA